MSLAHLDDLNNQQKVICRSEENLLVTACPGSGKTRTLTYKICHFLLTSKSIKRIVAITYTNRAADEIIKRLSKMGVDYSRVWVGTIHQFCLDFILNRFRTLNPNISKKYTIIDEKITDEYLNQIAKKYDVKISYENKPNLKTDRNLKTLETNANFLPIIRDYYNLLKERKEIDFDMILSHSINILKKSNSICSIIKNSIELMCIDEYQDTQDLQYAIIEKIYNSDLSIKMQINFFGDPNQSIFESLGGCAKTLTELNKEFLDGSFKELFLDGCYRSHQNTIDFYSKFMVRSYSIKSMKDGFGKIYFSDSIKKDDLFENVTKIIEFYLKKGVPEREICVVAPVWTFLFPLSHELKKRLPNVSFDAPDITPIKRDPLNVFYNICYLVLNKPKLNTHLYRIKVARNIIDRVRSYTNFDKEDIELLNYINSITLNENNGVDYLKKAVSLVLKFLNVNNLEEYETLNNEYNMFFDKIYYRIDKYKLSYNLADFKNMFSEKNGIVVNTIHGIKGEEYKVVIAFGLLKSKIPSIFCQEERKEDVANKLLYVLFSRCKEHLILISEKRYTGKPGNYYLDCCTPFFSEKNVSYQKFSDYNDFLDMI